MDYSPRQAGSARCSAPAPSRTAQIEFAVLLAAVLAPNLHLLAQSLTPFVG